MRSYLLLHRWQDGASTDPREIPAAGRAGPGPYTPLLALQRQVGNRGFEQWAGQHLQTHLAGGQPLDRALAADARLGAGLDRVRVHTGEAAARSTAALNARAYTVGQDIVFGAGEYAPQTPGGRQLLAHELAHARQQADALPASEPQILPPDHPTEMAAVRAGQVAVGSPAAMGLPAAGTRGLLAGGGQPALAQQAIQRQTKKPVPAATSKPEAKTEAKKETETRFGSPAWPWLVIEPVLVKLPSRWSEAVRRARLTRKDILFDPRLGHDLAFRQLTGFHNLFWAATFGVSSSYKPDFSKGLEMAESLSGVEDSYLNLAGLALRLDLKKYLEDDLPPIVQANLGWAIMYGLLLQGGLVGLNAGLEKDLDFTTLLKPALKKWTEAPQGFARPYLLPNIPDPRWSAYSLWSSPSGFEVKTSDFYEASKPSSLNLTLGLNIASLAGLYPEKDEDKKKYRGFELYPYFSYGHTWAKEGQPPSTAADRWLAGLFIGSEGIYTVIEGGERRGPGGERLETYAREGLFLRGLGPFTLIQATFEQSDRPGPAGLRSRLNVASTIKLVDNKTWLATLGAQAGGLLPGGGWPGALDVGGQASLYYKHATPGKGEPFKTGLELSSTWRPQDPFDPGSARLFSLRGSLSAFDILRFAVEYHQATGSAPELNLPGHDTRFMIFTGPRLFGF